MFEFIKLDWTNTWNPEDSEVIPIKNQDHGILDKSLQKVIGKGTRDECVFLLFDAQIAFIRNCPFSEEDILKEKARKIHQREEPKDSLDFSHKILRDKEFLDEEDEDYLTSEEAEREMKLALEDPDVVFDRFPHRDHRQPIPQGTFRFKNLKQTRWNPEKAIVVKSGIPGVWSILAPVMPSTNPHRRVEIATGSEGECNCLLGEYQHNFGESAPLDFSAISGSLHDLV